MTINIHDVRGFLEKGDIWDFYVQSLKSKGMRGMLATGRAEQRGDRVQTQWRKEFEST